MDGKELKSVLKLLPFHEDDCREYVAIYGIQFVRLLEEIRSNIDLGDDGYSLLSDSMDLEQTEVDELFDRAMVEFQRTKNSGRALRETPDKDIKAYHSGGQIASIR